MILEGGKLGGWSSKLRVMNRVIYGWEGKIFGSFFMSFDEEEMREVFVK